MYGWELVLLYVDCDMFQMMLDLLKRNVIVLPKLCFFNAQEHFRN